LTYDVRKLNIHDYDQLIGLWDRCGLPYRPKGRDSRELINLEMQRSETFFIGLFDSEKLIGFVLGTSDGRKGWINRLAIDPAYQRQGLGSFLIDECEKYLKDLGLKVIACLIEESNQASRAAFDKAGYELHNDILYFSKRTSIND